MPSSHPFKCHGADITIRQWARILQPEVIALGDAVMIDDFVFLAGGESTDIGSFVHLAGFSSLVGGGTLVIGDFAGVSTGARIFTGTDDFGGSGLTGPTVPPDLRAVTRSSVRIGRHAVIGANSVVLPGVTIGEGATIGANSLVIRDCEPWTLYAGSPVRAIKPRPRERILASEEQLRARCYDDRGRYIPGSARRGGSPQAR